MFLQIHTFTSYPSALLNRDEVGLAKRIPFGGVSRTRISSQCLKRHWRTFQGEHSLLSLPEDDGTVPMSVRSRRIFENEIRIPLEKAGIGEEIASAVADSLMAVVLGESTKKEKNGKDKPKDPTAAREKVETAQVVVLGRPEVRFLYDQALAIAKKTTSTEGIRDIVQAHFKGAAGENLKSLRHGAGLDAALFGRMITSDLLARCDASVHVAHAYTVHGETSESDYFSVVDDLFPQGEDPQLGSGHIGTSELTSGLYYSYVVVDIPLLVSNLQGCERRDWQAADCSLSARVIDRLLWLIATVSPGAKLGSTAPYAYAHAVLVEIGISQPRSLGNAFLVPVDPKPDLLRNTYEALSLHLHELDAIYGNDNERRFIALRPAESLHTVATREENGISGLAQWAAQRSVA
jgi:CRISPR system Cascade subunit CasC